MTDVLHGFVTFNKNRMTLFGHRVTVCQKYEIKSNTKVCPERDGGAVTIISATKT